MMYYCLNLSKIDTKNKKCTDQTELLLFFQKNKKMIDLELSNPKNGSDPVQPTNPEELTVLIYDIISIVLCALAVIILTIYILYHYTKKHRLTFPIYVVLAVTYFLNFWSLSLISIDTATVLCFFLFFFLIFFSKSSLTGSLFYLHAKRQLQYQSLFTYYMADHLLVHSTPFLDHHSHLPILCCIW